MTTIPEALDALLDAARTVAGVNVYQGDGTGTLRTPAVVVSLPVVRWERYCPDPTSGRFTVTIAVGMNEYAMGRLLELLPLVHAAVEDTGATVNEATPVPFNSPIASSGLVGYQLDTEFPL